MWKDSEDLAFDYGTGSAKPSPPGAVSGKKSKGSNTYPPRPKLPPKVIFNNFSPKLMEQRRVMLARYLRYLYLNPYSRSSVPFLSFIAGELMSGL